MARSLVALVGTTPVLSPQGELDLAALPSLHGALQRLALDHPGATVAVDLDQVVAIDDAALGVLLGAAGRVRERGGELFVVTANPNLAERLRRNGFDRAVEVRARVTP